MTILKRPEPSILTRPTAPPPGDGSADGVNITDKAQEPASADARRPVHRGERTKTKDEASGQGFLDKVVAALKDVPLDVDEAIDETGEQDEGEAEAVERNTLFDGEPISQIKRYYKKDDKAMLQDFNYGLVENLKQSRPELKRTVAKMRANYFQDLGGKEKCSEMVSGTVDAILRAELLSHLIFTEGLKAGICRFNRSNKKLTLNPALEQYPKFENLSRLLKKSLYEMTQKGRTIERASITFAVDDESNGNAREVATEMMQLLGTPLDEAKIKKITLERRKET